MHTEFRFPGVNSDTPDPSRLGVPPPDSRPRLRKSKGGNPSFADLFCFVSNTTCEFSVSFVVFELV